MRVADIMTEKVHKVSPNDTLANLKNIFDTVSYHHLLVEQNGKLVGVISDRDVLASSSPFLGTGKERQQDVEQQKLKVAEIMATDMVTVSRDTTIEYASILLAEKGISCLPIVNGNFEIVGIVTWKDFLLYFVYGTSNGTEE